MVVIKELAQEAHALRQNMDMMTVGEQNPALWIQMNRLHTLCMSAIEALQKMASAPAPPALPPHKHKTVTLSLPKNSSEVAGSRCTKKKHAAIERLQNKLKIAIAAKQDGKRAMLEEKRRADLKIDMLQTQVAQLAGRILENEAEIGDKTRRVRALQRQLRRRNRKIVRKSSGEAEEVAVPQPNKPQGAPGRSGGRGSQLKKQLSALSPSGQQNGDAPVSSPNGSTMSSDYHHGSDGVRIDEGVPSRALQKLFDVLQHTRIDSLAQSAARAARALIRSENVHILVLNVNAQVFLLVGDSSPPDKLTLSLHPAEDGDTQALIREIMSTTGPVIITDAQRDARVSQWKRSFPIEDGENLVLQSVRDTRGNVLSIVCVSQPRNVLPTENEKGLLFELSRHMGVALLNIWRKRGAEAKAVLNQQIVGTVARIVRQGNDEPSIIMAMTTQIGRILGAHRCLVCLAKEDHLWTSYGDQVVHVPFSAATITSDGDGVDDDAGIAETLIELPIILGKLAAGEFGDGLLINSDGAIDLQLSNNSEAHSPARTLRRLEPRSGTCSRTDYSMTIPLVAQDAQFLGAVRVMIPSPGSPEHRSDQAPGRLAFSAEDEAVLCKLIGHLISQVSQVIRHSASINLVQQVIAVSPEWGLYETVDHVTALAKRHINCDRVHLLLIDRASRQLIVPKDYRGEGAEEQRYNLQTGRCANGGTPFRGYALEVVRTHRIINRHRAFSEPEFAAYLPSASSVLSVPVHCPSGDILGVLEAINKQPPRGLGVANKTANPWPHFSTGDEQAAKLIAGQLGANLRLLIPVQALLTAYSQIWRHVELFAPSRLYSCESLPSLLQRLAQNVLDTMRVERSHWFIFDRENRDRFWSQMTIADSERMEVPADRGVLGEVWRTRRPFLYQQHMPTTTNADVVMAEHRKIDAMLGQETRCLMAVPVIAPGEEEPLAVLQVVNKAEGFLGDSFSDQEQKLLTVIAGHGAVAIARQTEIDEDNAQFKTFITLGP